MAMDAGVDTHSLRSTNHLGDLTLVHGTQTSGVGVYDLAGGVGEVGNDGEVLSRQSVSFNSTQPGDMIPISKSFNFHFLPCTYPVAEYPMHR
jgi:hypothetical protein